MSRRVRSVQDAGFTVVELLIAIVIGGIVAGTAGAAMVIGLQTTFSSAEKLNTSGNAALLSQYFVPDVQGTRTSGISTASTAGTGCSGSAAGTNTLALTWTDAITSVVYSAAYRLDGTTLFRHHCAGGGTPSVRPVARDVVGTPVVTVAGAVVAMTVTVRDADATSAASDYSFTVRAVRRATDSTCTVLQPSMALSPQPVLLSTSQPTRLQGNLTLTFSTTGLCTSAPTASYFYASGSLTGTGVASTGGGTWTATLPSTAPGAWTAGMRSVSVTAPGGTATLDFEVVDPAACVATSPATVTPSSPAVTGTGALTSPVVVSFSTSGSCGSTGTLAFQYDSSGTYRTVAASRTGPDSNTSWSASTASASPAVTWTPGLKNFTLTAGTASRSGDFTVVSAAPCTVSAVNLASSTATLALGYATQGPLSGTVGVTVTTTGFCASAPTVTYVYGSGTGTAPTPSPSGSTWTTSLPATAPGPWVTGGRTVTATIGASTASATLTVDGACGLTTGLTLNPSTVNKTGNNIDKDVVVTFSTGAVCAAADLRVTYQYGENASKTATVGATADAPSVNADGTKRWKATIPRDASGEAWTTDASKPVTVTLGTVVTSASLKVS